MIGYPLLLDLTGHEVLVAGAGAVATRRIGGLLDAHAHVTVVAPRVSDRVHTWAAEGRLVLHQRPVRAEDVDVGLRLVHACTDDTAANTLVADTARAHGIWCIRADDRTRSEAWVPAVLRHDDIVVAVNAGGDPVRARELRDQIRATLFGPG